MTIDIRMATEGYRRHNNYYNYSDEKNGWEMRN